MRPEAMQQTQICPFIYAPSAYSTVQLPNPGDSEKTSKKEAKRGLALDAVSRDINYLSVRNSYFFIDYYITT